jgi:hypothetical protein
LLEQGIIFKRTEKPSAPDGRTAGVIPAATLCWQYRTTINGSAPAPAPSEQDSSKTLVMSSPGGWFHHKHCSESGITPHFPPFMEDIPTSKGYLNLTLAHTICFDKMLAMSKHVKKRLGYALASPFYATASHHCLKAT